MVRNQRNSRTSAWIAAWLIIGQMLSFGPTAAIASEPAVAKNFAAQQTDDVGIALLSDSSALASEDMPPPEEDSEAAKEDSDTQEDDKRQDQRSGQRNRLDQDLVRQGQNYFQSARTMCHDAERATSKRKSLAGWLATVRRMAAKEDADVPAAQHTAIATYLASLNPADEDGEGDESEGTKGADAVLAAAEADVPSFTLNGTLSPVYRGTDPEVENRGFFPDVWVDLEWRPPSSPVSGKVTVCSSCHGTSNDGLGVELVEASATLDLCHLLTSKTPAERPHCRTTAELEMGRFIVPFGAFSGRVHPGALRTVSLPLMYNMGRRVGPIGPGQPVLNQPYSDEGANLHLEYDLYRDWDVTFDTYAVNGLQFGGPGVFFFSRSCWDNNSNVAVGGRATVGNERWRFGGSIAGGNYKTRGPRCSPTPWRAAM